MKLLAFVFGIWLLGILAVELVVVYQVRKRRGKNDGYLSH